MRCNFLKLLFLSGMLFFVFTCTNKPMETLSGENPQPPPQEQSGGIDLSMQVTAEALVANGHDQAVVTVSLQDSSGVKLAAQTIQLTFPPQLRQLSGGYTTNSLGQISAIFVSDQPGIFTIKATYILAMAQYSDSVRVSFSSANSNLIIDSAYAENDTMFFYDETKIVVNIRAIASGLPLKNQLVLFFIQDKKLGTVTDSAMTDSVGNAYSKFISANVPGPAAIEVSAGGIYRLINVYVAAGESKAAEIVAVTNRSRIQVKGAGGISNSTIIFTVLTKRGTPISINRRALVRISLVQHPGGGLYLSDTLLYTDERGRVETVLNAGIRSGNTIIKGEVIDATTPVKIATIRSLVTITGGSPDLGHFHLAPSMNKLNIWGWDIINNIDTIHASVADKYGNPVPEGYVVNFWTTGGTIEGSGVTNMYGQTKVLLFTGGQTGSENRGADSTNFVPLRDDLDLRKYLFPADLQFRDSANTVDRFCVKESYVPINPLLNIRHESSRTGDGQAIVFASISDDASSFGCDTCKTKLLWATTRVIFSGIPYGPYKVSVTTSDGQANSNDTNVGSIAIEDQGSATFSFWLTDVNGNPLAAGTSVILSTDNKLFADVKSQFVNPLKDIQTNQSRFVAILTDTVPRTYSASLLPSKNNRYSSIANIDTLKIRVQNSDINGSGFDTVSISFGLKTASDTTQQSIIKLINQGSEGQFRAEDYYGLIALRSTLTGPGISLAAIAPSSHDANVYLKFPTQPSFGSSIGSSHSGNVYVNVYHHSGHFQFTIGNLTFY